ncbi:RNA polymerase sigma factor [Trinickia terrae]|uniref:RNA polymerase sigma factor n=1 Tax=Trinickia terrae TaxID=2571161 RepID=A0A4U1HGL2_9BURK|nr:RNA polymerase sigma factor [Trinickia terrae]TKC78958.1 RNA polymerase sigma factor [Trinickia terrae]
MDRARTALQSAADDDLSIARRIAAGDRAAFELMMRRHNRRLYRLARAALRNDAEAEDALQDAYVSAYRSIGRFRGDAALFTWLARLVLNECFGRLRRENRRQNVFPIVELPSSADIEAMSANESDSPDNAAARAEVRALVERKLDALPEAFRVVFMLRSVEEMSVEETAQCLAIPEATVRSRHFRAKSMLRESLAREIDLAERDLFEFGGRQCDGVVAKVLHRLGAAEGEWTR